MSSLGKLWAGRVYGTNTGNLFIEFETTVGEIIGTFRFNDPQFGVVVYKITGVFNDSLRVSGESITAQEGVEYGKITAEARLTPSGSLRGTWHSTIGTGGTFEAFPHDINSPAVNVPIKSDVPEQLYSKSIHLGSVRIFGENLKRLLDDLSAEFVGARPVVTYNNRGSQVSKYASDFIVEMPLLGPVNTNAVPQ